VTALGKSFLQNGMKILPTSAQWPALPAAEVAVIGEDPATQHVVEPLVSIFVDVLSESLVAVAGTDRLGDGAR
jgi:hypothetical protein